MNLGTTSAALGFVASAVIVFLTVRHQKRFDAADLASYAAAYLAGNNIPIAIFLCCYVFSPDDAQVLTKLRTYEKYVSLAGLCFLFLSTFSIWTLAKKAVEKSAAEANSQSNSAASANRVPS